MLIYPAIDLINGRCVRLLHGDFDQVTRYGDPVDQIKAFADAGADWVHVVDLDGARTGAPAQTELIGRMARVADVRIQCGGGVRAEKDVAALLDTCIARVVVGSVATHDPETVHGWINARGSERICCAFDVRPHDQGYDVAVSGWRETSSISLGAALDAYEDSALRHVLVTDISRDGALMGPNLALIAYLAQTYPTLAIQASGGVSALHELAALREAGAAGVIIGRALYEGRFSLEAALAS